MGAERDWGQVALTDSVTHAHRRNTCYSFPPDPTTKVIAGMEPSKFRCLTPDEKVQLVLGANRFSQQTARNCGLTLLKPVSG